MRAEAIHFHQCINPRCPCNYYPSEVSSACPVCGVGGAVAGLAFKDLDAEREADAKAGDDIPFT